jgi:late competence protein required for DNA uptake (superfamily II DNA/RNA helicase)
VSRAVRDLLAMLDVPVSLDQQQLLQAKLQMQEQLSDAQRELKALRGGLTTAEEELEKYKEAFTCQICMDRNANVALVRCGHRFCNECMHRLQVSSQNQKCAYCRQTYTDTVPFFTGT